MENGTLPPAGTSVRVPLRFSQADFDRFARISSDDNPIHVDPAYAAGTRFGRTVAHGMMLFAAAHAAVNRWVGGPVVLHAQHLMFPAPTFADEDLALQLTVRAADRSDHRSIEIVLRSPSADTCRGAALVGFDELDPVAPPPPASASGTGVFRGMRVGMRAERIRTPDRSDIRALTALVDDPHPAYLGEHPQVPAPLLGGMISDLLGVTLPGPGTNWLKQTYRFHRAVPVGTEMRAAVQITRLRPEKSLVNLSTVCETDKGVALTGEALVLARDVERVTFDV